MPLDVIMPALGMAQNSGVILKWHKSPGDSVAEGDALFEVETDKAAMEVEAQGNGYLTDVSAQAGDEVPVGQVLARISETPEDSGTATDTAQDSSKADEEAGTADIQGDSGDIPDGEEVIMPALGMTQDAGLIVAWLKSPGDSVSATDILFEVETDKSIMEVEAGHDGFVAALLAEKGEEAPVGDVIAIITSEKPESPISRSIKSSAAAKPAAAPEEPALEPEPKKTTKPVTKKSPTGKPAPVTGRILASPKARRLALERGLDLSRLAEQGYPQPYHVKDLDVLASLPTASAANAAAAAVSRTLSAEVSASGFDEFVRWATHEAGVSDAGALLAGFAGTSLGRKTATVAVEAFGETRVYSIRGRRLAKRVEADDGATPDLRLRDLRFCRLSSIQTGAEDTPVISVLTAGKGLKLTLECAAEQLDASTAVHLLSEFAGRMEQPLRHLL
jgi:pyruvate/2-oxoglutarate dehydrogenase complex dihydrolipoamide acyltransferase (E2) component